MINAYVIPTKENLTYYNQYNVTCCIKWCANKTLERIVFLNGTYKDKLSIAFSADNFFTFIDRFCGDQYWEIVSKKKANRYIKNLITNAKNKYAINK